MIDQKESALKEILAISGKEFYISLESNPSTGYLWDAIFDRSSLELVNREYHRSSTAIGGGGVTVLTFNPKTMGRAVLEMRLKRSWEEDAIKILRYEIVISSEMDGHPKR